MLCTALQCSAVPWYVPCLTLTCPAVPWNPLLFVRAHRCLRSFVPDHSPLSEGNAVNAPFAAAVHSVVTQQTEALLAGYRLHVCEGAPTLLMDVTIRRWGVTREKPEGQGVVVLMHILTLAMQVHLLVLVPGVVAVVRNAVAVAVAVAVGVTVCGRGCGRL